MAKTLKIFVGVVSVFMIPLAIVYTAWKWANEWIDGAPYDYK